MEKHANISVFVPHIGCPNKCSFCNQCYISGKVDSPTPADVDNAVAVAMGSKSYSPENTEIAFFGGSFTAIDREYMVSLLESASRYVKEDKVSGIRISTRPDAISEEILTLLKGYGVTAIELGAQSMRDSVLEMNNRGHSREDVVCASRLIKNFGFSLGLQMMTGLYGSDNKTDLYTAKEILSLNPDTVRIYPTIVLRDTDLATLYSKGKYKPQTVDDAAELCSKILQMFENTNTKVIRLGLHSIEEESYVAGPWHPAFSEICQSKLFLERAKNSLSKKGNYTIFVNKSSVSKMIGQNRENIKRLKDSGFNCRVLADETLGKNDMRVEGEK
ncbi:MAG: radical SAM protein [Clostridia bacterium]|nr:radical SAM protein [Clostridia bacterium]